MSSLTAEDRNKLIRILESLPILQTFRSRRRLLEASDLDVIIPLINLEGSSFEVAGEILQILEKYGKVTFEKEALGIFLSTVKEFIGSANENRVFIDNLLTKYCLMKPEKETDYVPSWNWQFDFEETQEKIIGDNTLRHISFLKRGLEVSRSVAFVDVGEWTGTGFMISPCLLLTNNHVIPDRELLSKSVFRFNYQLTFKGTSEKSVDYIAKDKGLFHTNPELDYTLVELDGEPGLKWGISSLSIDIIGINSRVNIIQHPAGLPKQISFQNNFVRYADTQFVQYITSTMCGSSGSPVFNDSWQVVALHHAGGMIMEPSTKKHYFRNEGIAINAICNDVRNNINISIFGV